MNLQSVTKIVRLAPLPTDLMFVASLLAHSRPALSRIAFTGLAQNWARGARVLIIFRQVKCFLGLFYGIIVTQFST